MKKNDVPQDQSPTYEGVKKLIYAVSDDGHYEGVKSSGWEVECFATELAVSDLKSQALESYQLAKQNIISPLAYHMAVFRFDLTSLAQCTGFFQWQIKRHLKPQVFGKLSMKKLQIYADVMNISIEMLKALPTHNDKSEKESSD